MQLLISIAIAISLTLEKKERQWPKTLKLKARWLKNYPNNPHRTSSLCSLNSTFNSLFSHPNLRTTFITFHGIICPFRRRNPRPSVVRFPITNVVVAPLHAEPDHSFPANTSNPLLLCQLFPSFIYLIWMLKGIITWLKFWFPFLEAKIPFICMISGFRISLGACNSYIWIFTSRNHNAIISTKPHTCPVTNMIRWIFLWNFVIKWRYTIKKVGYGDIKLVECLRKKKKEVKSQVWLH